MTGRGVEPPIGSTLSYIRALRTSTSERFVLQLRSIDVAALDIHYLSDGTVQASLVVIDGAGIEETMIPELLTHIDEVLLPDVSLDDKKLLFTVVLGRILGSFEATHEGEDHPDSTTPQHSARET